MFENKFLIFLTLNVLIVITTASPVFEPSENIVDDSVAENNDDAPFDQRSNFGDMNDFNFETPVRDEDNSNALNQQEGNQSAEQSDDDGPSSQQGARERPPINKTADEETDAGAGDESDEAKGGRNEPAGRTKQRYQDAEENGSARSLDSFDKDNGFDKDSADEKNEFEGNEEANRPNSAEEQGQRQGPPAGLQAPPPMLEQIDEPILVGNGGPPMPLPLHGRPPMMGRSNSEEEQGGNYFKETKFNKLKNSHQGSGAPGSSKGSNRYKFLPGGISYLHEKTGVNKNRVAPYLASFASATTDQLASGKLFNNVFNKPKPIDKLPELHGLQS